jgi:NodT family efflux transporter outer membrane factor (OMF) lipoprotein
MRRLGALIAALLSGGCLVGPDYVPPRPEMPDAWHQQLARGLAEGEADFQRWWSLLGDPMLDSLMDRAVEGNLDLREAVARIEESRARLGIAKGERVPDLDSIGGVQRQRLSENLAGAVAPPLEREDTIHSAGFDAFWEVDVWGRVRRSVESAAASEEASIESYRDILVSLYAEVARSYVDVRTLQQRLTYARANADTQRGSLELTRERNRAGLVGDLDVRQAELNLARTESFIPVLEQGLAAAIHRLGVLTGDFPSALYTALAPTGDIPGPPDRVLVGLPAELLRQRPDVRRAERDLASRNARIGVATADLYPRFSLVGTFAFDSVESDKWIDAASRGWVFGPSVRWNLFDGRRVRNAIRTEEALTAQALARYENTLLRALQEVEDSMVAFVQEQDRRDALERSATAAAAAVKLVEELYRLGLTDFQNVLDTQRSLFDQQDALAESEGFVTQDLIRIYKALGGGWAP